MDVNYNTSKGNLISLANPIEESGDNYIKFTNGIILFYGDISSTAKKISQDVLKEKNLRFYIYIPDIIGLDYDIMYINTDVGVFYPAKNTTTLYPEDFINDIHRVINYGDGISHVLLLLYQGNTKLDIQTNDYYSISGRWIIIGKKKSSNGSDNNESGGSGSGSGGNQGGSSGGGSSEDTSHGGVSSTGDGYTKYNDGTLVCTGSIVVAKPSLAYNPQYATYDVDLNTNFTSTDYTVTFTCDSTDIVDNTISTSNHNYNWFNIVVRNYETLYLNKTLYWTATGKWK